MTAKSFSGLRLFVNQKAIIHNYQLICKKFPDSKHGAVVKANGYGLGAVELSKILLQAGCQAFYVARPAEGVPLREALGQEPNIYVFHGHETAAFDLYHKYHLTPVLHSLETVNMALGFAPKLSNSRLKVAFKLNSGMNRLGLDLQDLKQINWTKVKKFFDVDSVHSHLACGRSPIHEMNDLQFGEFNNWAATYFKSVPRGLTASCQAVLGDDYALDLTRQGLNLVGAYPPPEAKDMPFQFALKLQARCIQIRSIDPGASVGYDATFAAQKPMKIATISMGYADGLPLSLKSYGFDCQIAGHRAPVIGLVSMDLATLDVTDIPNSLLEQNSWVDVFYDNMSLYNLAQASNGSMHDILLGIGPRCERIYI